MLSIRRIKEQDIKATPTSTYFQSHKFNKIVIPFYDYLNVPSAMKKVWKISPYHGVFGSMLLVRQYSFHVRFIGSRNNDNSKTNAVS